MRKIFAFLLTLGVLCAFAACGGEDTADPVTHPATVTTTEPEPVTPAIVTSQESDPSAPVVTTDPTTEALQDIDPLKLFNDATKMVKDLKPGYTKTRYTKITDLDFGLLGQFQIVKDAVYGFFDVESSGEGTLNTTVTKGKSSDQLRASKWTAADVKSAEAKPDGKGGWIVTLLIKDGNTRWSGEGGGDPGGGTLNSPVDKGPLCYGTDDNDKYDHKTARNIYLSINGADNANTKDIGENSYGIKLVADIDAEGRLQKLYGYMEMTVQVHHVKYLFVTLTNKAGSGYGEVTYENFSY